MQRKEVEAIFDRQAASYDQQWARLAPLRAGLDYLVGQVLADLPADARILCVGAGTGSEIIELAQRFPRYRFCAVEPSGPMLAVCRRRVEAHGLAGRCDLHQGYVESLPPSAPFDAATSLLVSQFIMDESERSRFFRAISNRLRPGGYLVNADLAADLQSPGYESLLRLWLRMMNAAEVPPEMIERMRAAYGRDVAVLPPERIAAIVAAGGFSAPIGLFQGALIHAWYCTAKPEASTP